LFKQIYRRQKKGAKVRDSSVNDTQGVLTYHEISKEDELAGRRTNEGITTITNLSEK